MLLDVLTHPAMRKLFGVARADEARRIVGQFRAGHDLFADDPAFVERLSAPRAGCPEFNGGWKAHEARSSAPATKRLRHPTRGVLQFEHASFTVSDEPGLRLVIYNPL